MQDNNPYSAPDANLEVEAPPRELRLGGRGERLGAAMLDGIIAMAVIIPVMFATGMINVFFEAARGGAGPGLGFVALSFLLGVGTYALVQGYPLSQAGQTWGKKMLKLKIVDLEGRKPSLLRLIGVRFAVNRLLGMVPVLGTLYGLIDILCIFREDRRCIHDMIAGTRVVVAE